MTFVIKQQQKNIELAIFDCKKLKLFFMVEIDFKI